MWRALNEVPRPLLHTKTGNFQYFANTAFQFLRASFAFGLVSMRVHHLRIRFVFKTFIKGVPHKSRISVKRRKKDEDLQAIWRTEYWRFNNEYRATFFCTTHTHLYLFHAKSSISLSLSRVCNRSRIIGKRFTHTSSFYRRCTCPRAIAPSLSLKICTFRQVDVILYECSR